MLFTNDTTFFVPEYVTVCTFGQLQLRGLRRCNVMFQIFTEKFVVSTSLTSAWH